MCATFQIASACCAFGLFWRTWHRPWRSANRSFNSPRSRWWHDSSSCFTTTLLPGEKIHKFGSHRFSSCTNLICFQKNQEGMKKNSRDRFFFIKSIENHLLISKDFSKISQPLTSQHHLNLSSSNYNIYSSTKINKKKTSSSKAFSGPSTCMWFWTAVTEGIGRGFGRLRFEGGTRLPSSFQQIIQGARRHGGTRKRSGGNEDWNNWNAGPEVGVEIWL